MIIANYHKEKKKIFFFSVLALLSPLKEGVGSLTAMLKFIFSL